MQNNQIFLFDNSNEDKNNFERISANNNYQNGQSNSQSLNNYNSKPARILEKALDSAIANAVNNNKLDQNKLYVKHISIDMGQTLKRMVPGSRGSTDKNYHRTSNVNIVVAEK